MYTCRALLFAVACCGFFPLAALAQKPGLGEPLQYSLAGAPDLTALPNGKGLPVGSGSAVEGESVYRQRCLACHGTGGKEGINDQLAGGRGTLASQRPVKTIGSYWPYATTVFDYVRRAMPYNAPGSLSNDEVYAVTAYLLYINGILDQGQQLDASSLPSINMPNQQGFFWSTEPR